MAEQRIAAKCSIGRFDLRGVHCSHSLNPDVRQEKTMQKLIAILLLCIGISACCATIPSDFRSVWTQSGSPPENLPTPSGFSISPAEAFRIAQESRRLSLKHVWHLYSDSDFYYIHDTFLGDGSRRAFTQGLRINGRSGTIIQAEQDGGGNSATLRASP